MSFLLNSLLFDFKEIKIEQQTKDNDSIDKALQKFVEELNKKIDHNYLIFEYKYDINYSIFYLTLKIDNNRTLNILRAKMKIKDEETQKYKIISFNDIVWMYCLSEKFMNKIFKEGKKILSDKKDKFYYFYVIMSKYYEVLDLQIDEYLKKNNDNFYDIIYIFNFIVLNGYYDEYIEDFNSFFNPILNKNNENNIINLNLKFKSIMFLFLIKDKDIQKDIEDINFSFDIEYFSIFYDININNFENKLDLIDKYFKGNIKYVNNNEIIFRYGEKLFELIFYEKNLFLKVSQEVNDKYKKYDLRANVDEFHNNIDYGKIKQECNIDLDKRKVFLKIDTNLKGYILGFFIAVNFIISNKKIKFFMFKHIVFIFFKKLFEIKDENINKKYQFMTKDEDINKKYKIEYSKYLLKLLQSFSNIYIKYKNTLSKMDTNFLINFIEFFFSQYALIKDDKMDLAFNILFNTFDQKNNREINRFLIISYNEENKDYDFIDCIPILYRILFNKPVFIVLGTQESTSKITIEGSLNSKATHYVHVLGKYLKEIDYRYDDMKESGHKIKVKDKNVRIRIFFYDPQENGQIIITNKNGNKQIQKKISINNINTNSYVNTTNFSFKKINTYFKTFYRGAIFFKMIIKINGEYKKFIFVNAHLYFDESNQSDIGREKKFIDLITKPVFNADKYEESKKNLIELYDIGYNIFFFGDLCFGKNSTNANELETFLRNENIESPQFSTVEDIIRFKNILLSSIDENIPTTYKYESSNYNSRIANIQSNNGKYTPDRILYALQTIDQSKKQLETYTFPYKSKHLMVSLSLELIPKTNIEQNIKNIENTLPYLFDLSEKIYKVNSSQSTNIKKFEKSVIDKFVLELNDKLNNDKLFFESKLHYQKESEIMHSENRNAGQNKKDEIILYLTLNIDGNVLNIFSAKVEIRDDCLISFKDIKWQYNLSTDFMNYVYIECKKTGNFNKLFYDIMFVYYQVVEEQLKLFIDLYKDKKTNLVTKSKKKKQYILFFYIFIKKKLFEDVSLLNSFKDNKFIEYYDIEFLNTFLLLMNDNIFETNFKINIKLDLYFFFIFFTFDNLDISFNINEELNIKKLKEYFFENNYNFIFLEHFYGQIRRLYPSVNHESKIFLTYKDNNNTIKNNIVNLSNTEDIKKKKIDEILKKRINNKDFLFIASYLSSISLLTGDIDSIIHNLLDIFLNGNDDLNIYIDVNNKKINYNAISHLTLFNTYFLQPDDTFKNPDYNLYNNEKITEKILKYKFDVDYLKKCVDIEIDFKIKGFIIKILRLCIHKKIKNYKFIICLTDFLIKIDEKYLEYFYNIFYNYLEKSNLPDSIIDEQNYNFCSEENSIFDMLILSYNEGNQKFNIIDCLPILYKVSINQPSFIVIGTQESGTSLERKPEEKNTKFLGEATHYPHVLGTYLEKMGYSILDKADAFKGPKIKNENVRFRVYYNNAKVALENSNKNIIVNKVNKNKNGFTGFSNIISKKSFYRGAIFFEMIIKNKGFEQKIIFVNTHLYFGNNNGKGYQDRKEKFLYLMNKKLFGGKKSLVKLYEDKYNIFFFGDLNFQKTELENFLNNNNNNANILRKDFTIGINSENNGTILYALKTINSNNIIPNTYDYPDKSDHNMVSLSLKLIRTYEV